VVVRSLTGYEVAMAPVTRVLPDAPVDSLDGYRSAGGGRGLEAARTMGAAAVVEEVEASGLRGRGGAGFPTGAKWRTVVEYGTAFGPATVVVNGAEGEPGSFKDRLLMRRSPYAVLEGALVAAFAVGADRVFVAVKSSFEPEQERLAAAIAELDAAGWTEGVALSVVPGPSEYLFGEETGLLEGLDGRPPFRHGVDELTSEPGEPAGTRMAQPGVEGAAPTLANNVETLANVPLILAEGPAAFRAVGTEASPGTIVCTISGATARAGVAEFALGTPLAEIIDTVGGGRGIGRTYAFALSGVANALIPAAQFDTPATYEDLAAIGSGLGAAGFVVFDDDTDPAAVAAGVARFLAIESCGQCTPCKHDGLAISTLLHRVCGGTATDTDLDEIADRVATVADEARCALARQHQAVIDSVLRLYPDVLRRHLDPATQAVTPELIVPIVDITDDGHVLLDEAHLAKQPDWTFDDVDSGKVPAERLAEQ
jgi:NADH:ubiquinone oxidoreductase subunit F (NADH-binding)